MAFTTRSFSGSTFFPDVRAVMTDRALFCGKDGDFRYIVMDAVFYRFEVFMRPATQMFVAAAENAQLLRSSVLRVISNASFVHDYGTAQVPLTGPEPQSYEGEVIIGHATSAGTPASLPDHRYIGQLDGATAAAIAMDRGDPSGVTVPGTFVQAIGGLLPIIKKGVPFGPKEVFDASGTIREVAGSNAIREWQHRLDGCGKSIVGVHRETDIVFVLMQRDGYTGGKSITDVIALLTTMGVDDAVMGDGSDSVTLVVDGVAELTPKFYKDKTLTTGFAFARWHVRMRSSSRFVRDAATTDPRFPDGFRLDMPNGFLLAEPAGRVVLNLTTLGVSVDKSVAQVLSELGVTVSLELSATTPQLTVTNTFTGPGGITASLRLEPDVEGSAFDGVMVGTVRGTVTFPTAQGQVVFRAILPMELQAI